MDRPNTFNRDKALNILRECRQLAKSFEEEGLGIAISRAEDRQALKGFEQVWLEGWLSDTTLPGEAGLTPAHIAILGYLLAQEQAQL